MAFFDAFGGVRRDWKLVVGLACLFLWTWLHYWGGAYSLRGFSIDVANARWALNIASCMVALGVTAVVALRSGTDPRARLSIARALQWAGCVAGLGGTAVALALVRMPVAQTGLVDAAALVSGALTGVGEGCFLCLWCTMTSYFGLRAALAYNVVALGASGLAFLACNVCPDWFAQVVGLACPIVGLVCAGAMRRQALEAFGGQMEGPDAQTTGLLGNREFLQLMAIALVFGVSCGFVNASFELVPAAQYRAACHWVVVGTILAASLSFACAFVWKLSAWSLAFKVSLPLMALAYLLLPHAAYGLVGPGIHSLGYQYFFVAFWPLLGAPQLRRDVPAIASVAVGLFVAYAGQALGLAVWNLACSGIGVAAGQPALAYASGVAMLAAVLVAVLFERPGFGWGSVRPGTEVAVVAKPADYSTVLDRIRQVYGLSPREAEVCALLGRGRNRQFVADELVISLETAKTHATNVYRKLGVHSQQELLDVIEMTQNELARKSAAA